MNKLNEARQKISANSAAFVKNFGNENYEKVFAKSEHPADIHRARNFAIEQAKNLIDSRDKDKTWNSDDQKCNELLMTAIDLADIQLNLNKHAVSDDTSFNSVKVFGKGEKFQFKNQSERSSSDLDGYHVGHMMRAMIDPKGRTAALQNSLAESSTGTGGATVPVELLSRLIDYMRSKSVCFNAGALTVPLTTNVTNIARLASDPAASWRLEGAAIPFSDPTFEQVQFNARSLAVIVKVSMELLQDSLNIEEALMNALAQSLALELDRVALNGTGTAPQPKGVTVDAGVSAVSMGTNGLVPVNYSQIITALQTLEDNNSNPATAAVMAPRSFYRYQGLTDTTGQPLNAPKVFADVPQLRTTAMPVNLTQGTSTDASNIVIGDFTQMLFGIRQEFSIQVLNQSFMQSEGGIGFLATLRADTALAHPKSFVKITGVR